VNLVQDAPAPKLWKLKLNCRDWCRADMLLLLLLLLLWQHWI